MNLNRAGIALLFAAFTLPLCAAQNSTIQGTDVNGSQQTTIVDQNGNLKVVPKDAPGSPAPKTMPAPNELSPVRPAPSVPGIGRPVSPQGSMSSQTPPTSNTIPNAQPQPPILNRQPYNTQRPAAPTTPNSPPAPTTSSTPNVVQPNPVPTAPMATPVPTPKPMPSPNGNLNY